MNEWSTELTPEIKADGTTYHVRVVGFQRTDGNWEGRLEFQNGDGRVMRTAHETTQPNLTDLRYWATGLEAVYLDGALQRALRNQK